MHRRPPCRFASASDPGITEGLAGRPFPTSERDHAIDLLDRGRAVQNLIDRALLQRSHSQVDGHAAEHVLGYLLEDEIAQLLAHDHDLEDPGPAHVSRLEARRATQAAVELQVAMLLRVEL